MKSKWQESGYRITHWVFGGAEKTEIFDAIFKKYGVEWFVVSRIHRGLIEYSIWITERQKWISGGLNTVVRQSLETALKKINYYQITNTPLPKVFLKYPVSGRITRAGKLK